jgi:DNA topoisomerase-1
MAKQLVIVESPAKAKTINRYLGHQYSVKSSMGHIRDLPKKKLGVDVDHDFQPEYEIIPERKKLVKELQDAALGVDSVLLAADPDREGEAICWHLSEVLKKFNKNIYRVLMHEITNKAVGEAFQNLGFLDTDEFNAQQTRRILDRLVGYLISPLLWEKIGRGLSAGRVQSIALRLICEREKEIKDFVPEEYWTIAAQLEADNPPVFNANLAKIDGKKMKIKDGKAASAVVSELWDLPFILQEIEIKKKKKDPSPPYITSSLQQDGFRLLRFPVRKTMSVAQKLYEGLEIGERGLTGLITYMRTDSVRISDEALSASRGFIKKNFASEYLPKKPRIYKNKRKAQDAHEAIRPASFDLSPETVQPFLKKEEFDLYNLIWKRFLASQMSSARVEETEFKIAASIYQFSAKGEVLEFDGYLALDPKQKKEERHLPMAQEGEKLKLLDIESKQNFTQPPPRYTEGSLVKELEAKGIGRPSTYAPIISTLQDRVYVVKDKGRFIPTDLGLFITEYLIQNFPDLMEFKFTARLESELDLISEGRQNWLDYLKSYYSLLQKDLDQAKKGESTKKTGIPVGEACPECGRPLVIKEGKYGRFRACSGFPECNFKESMVKKETKPLDEICPECGSQLVLRKGKYGFFVACSNYPQCTYVKKEKKDTGIACPQDCGGSLVRKKTRRGKIFYGCSNFPKCKFATWEEPIPRPCPECGRPFVLKKNMMDGRVRYTCSDENCSYKETVSKDENGDKT